MLNKPFATTAPLLRAQRPKTQAEFAIKLGVHVQFVSNWERGLCLPPVDVMRVIYKKMSKATRAEYLRRVSDDMGNEYKSKLLGETHD